MAFYYFETCSEKYKINPRKAIDVYMHIRMCLLFWPYAQCSQQFRVYLGWVVVFFVTMAEFVFLELFSEADVGMLSCTRLQVLNVRTKRCDNKCSRQELKCFVVGRHF